jgi:hypothetical protein
MQVARWMVDTMISSGVVDGAREPVREIVEEVLDAHRSEETPMVPAFETALEQDRTEDRA